MASSSDFLTIEYSSITDVGVRRSHNQDCHGVLLAGNEHIYEERGHLFIVADGMGAHAVGELASKIAVEQIPHMYQKHAALGPAAAIRKAISEANSSIHQKGNANREFHGMGTTATSLVIRPEGAWVGHVGDSRAYRVRGDYIEQISFDHSLQWELAKRQQVNPDSIAGIPSNVIVRSLGPENQVQVDVEGPHPLNPGDIFIVCSDGLSNQVTDQEMGAIFKALPADEACQFLVDLANLRGGPDNITVIAVKLPGEPDEGTAKKKFSLLDWIQQFYWIGPAFIVGSILAVFALILVGDGKRALGFTSFATAVGLIASGIVGLFLRQRQSNPMIENDSGPPKIYRRHQCSVDPALMQKFFQAESTLQEVAKESSWKFDIRKHRELMETASKNFKSGELNTAFVAICRAFHLLMACQRGQRNKDEQFKPNW